MNNNVPLSKKISLIIRAWWLMNIKDRLTFGLIDRILLDKEYEKLDKEMTEAFKKS